jgi:hypothetical protein
MTFDLKETSAGQLGWAGQAHVEAWLRSHGFFVIRLADILGQGAPSLEGSTQRLTLPDLQVAKAGASRYVEVKTKSTATRYAKSGDWEHGIEQRLFQHYRSVAETSGLPVWLCFYELRPARLVLLADTAGLRPSHVWDGKPTATGSRRSPARHYTEPMIYFRRDDFSWHPSPSDLPPIRPLTAEAPRTREEKYLPPSRKQGTLWGDA